MLFAYDGLRPPADLRRRIARGEAAGVILFARNVRSAGQVRAVTRSLQAIERPAGLRAPLIVAVDQEGGPVRRIPGAPQRAAAEAGTVARASADGRAAARTLRAAGVNLDLAPVADVARPGAALERERRIYGRDPGDVAALAAAFAAGLRRGRGAGDGEALPRLRRRDGQHRRRPRTDRRRTRHAALRRRPPVRPSDRRRDRRGHAVDGASYPALDERPAAFSARWVGELRGRLGFAGVTMSDDLATPAVKRYGSLGRRAVLAVRAGVDLPLFVRGYRAGTQAAAGLLDAARNRRLGAAAARRRPARARAARAAQPLRSSHAAAARQASLTGSIGSRWPPGVSTSVTSAPAACAAAA